MQVIRRTEVDHAQSIEALKGKGFEAVVELGKQALAALNTANLGDKARGDASEILQAVSLLASHLDGVSLPGQLDANDPKSIIRHLAEGGTVGKPLTKEQSKTLETYIESSIKDGTDLPQLAEAAKNMTYGNPALESTIEYMGANYGSRLQQTVCQLFETHQPRASEDLDVSDMGGGLETM